MKEYWKKRVEWWNVGRMEGCEAEDSRRRLRLCHAKEDSIEAGIMEE